MTRERDLALSRLTDFTHRPGFGSPDGPLSPHPIRSDALSLLYFLAASLMLRASRLAESAPPSRPGATPRGTQPVPPSSLRTPTARPSVSRQPSVHGRARLSTRKHHCFVRSRRCRSRLCAFSSSSVP